MKKLFFLLIIYSAFLSQKMFAQISSTAELFVYYSTTNSDYKIGIKPVENTTIYDKYFNPIVSTDSRYNEQVFDKVEFNACFQIGPPGAEIPPGSNGTVYYGKYQIRFLNISTSPPTTLAPPHYIDFRDANYNSSTSSYNNGDFFLYYDSAEEIYFQHQIPGGDTVIYDTDVSIWDFEPPRVPDDSRFKNFKLAFGRQWNISQQSDRSYHWIKHLFSAN